MFEFCHPYNAISHTLPCLASFPGLLQLQFLITCRIQKWCEKAWRISSRGLQHKWCHRFCMQLTFVSTATEILEKERLD